MKKGKWVKGEVFIPDLSFCMLNYKFASYITNYAFQIQFSFLLHLKLKLIQVESEQIHIYTYTDNLKIKYSNLFSLCQPIFRMKISFLSTQHIVNWI